MNFMNLPKENAESESKYAIVLAPIEGDVSYGKGASNGPAAIVRESAQLEYYDHSVDTEKSFDGIQTSKISFGKNHSENINLIAEEVKTKLQKKFFTVVLGGDHSTGIGILKGIKDSEKHKDFSVLQFDAHPDLFYSWNNSELNHRCFGYKAKTMASNLVQVGIRAMDVDEKEIIDTDNNILSFKAEEIKNNLEAKTKQILKKLKKKVYISIDVDVFDPSFIRLTGTPEPGGLMWNELMYILKKVFEEKEVIIADINEFAPDKKVASENDIRVESYSLAKLAYRLISLK